MPPKYRPGDKVRYQGREMYILWICYNDPYYNIHDPLYAIGPLDPNTESYELEDGSTTDAHESQLDPDIIDILRKVMK